MFTHLLIFTKVDGVWGTWAAWSTCSVTCGNGTQTRDRNCEFPPNAARGENCTGPTTDSQSCVLTPCHSEYFSGVRSIICCFYCLCLTRLLQTSVSCYFVIVDLQALFCQYFVKSSTCSLF